MTMSTVEHFRVRHVLLPLVSKHLAAMGTRICFGIACVAPSTSYDEHLDNIESTLSSTFESYRS